MPSPFYSQDAVLAQFPSATCMFDEQTGLFQVLVAHERPDSLELLGDGENRAMAWADAQQHVERLIVSHSMHQRNHDRSPYRANESDWSIP